MPKHRVAFVEEPMKRCTPELHAGLKADLETFRAATTYVGKQHYPWGEVQELRNCSCGTTLAYVLEYGTREEPGEGEH
jgi:hypothetical protein